MTYEDLISVEPQGSASRRDAARVRAESEGTANSALDWALECFAGYQFREGHAALAVATEREPGFLALKWLGFQYPLDPSPRDEAQQADFVQRWRNGLRWFESQDFRRPEVRQQLWGCIQSATPFYLHYVLDAVPEMRRYGRLLSKMMAVLDSGVATQPIRRNRRRIAIVSAHLREHTVSRLFLPMFERLDLQRFELHYLALEPVSVERQERLRRSGLLHLGPKEGLQWRQTLASIGPDIIVYPEIGMHAMHQGLAALRLAPVQMAMWGHPVTSGLSTIDYAVVPDALEPADAAAHYHEQLLRLPGLGHGLVSPTHPTRNLDLPGVRRAEPDTIEILCAQSVFKLLPAQDALFAKILRALPKARLHLTPLVSGEPLTELRVRMGRALALAGVDVAERVVTHAPMSLADFVALAGSCDFGIDTIGWSGGMSALDQLPTGLPIVALEGLTMRSRQTAALLRWLDVPEVIARDTDDLVTIALRLGTDPDLRSRLRRLILERAPTLYAQDATQEAFANFLGSVQPP
jgi:protein O-GlcNAc transferase